MRNIKFLSKDEGMLFSESDEEVEVEDNNKNFIEDEINIRVQERYEVSLREFKDFLSNPDFINSTGDPTTKIVDRRNMINDTFSPICYNLPDEKMSKFFKHLEWCRRKKVRMMMNEKQLEYSGIMLDFDIFQTHGETQINEYLYNKMCVLIGKQIYKYIDINNPIERPDLEHDTNYLKVYMAFTKKPKVVYNEEKGCFKDGFHMLIPSIKINRETKKFFIEICMNDKVFLEIFRDVLPAENYTYEDFIDKASAYVPVHFLGSSTKINSPPYKLDSVYEVRIPLNIDYEFMNIVPVKCMDLFDVGKNEKVILVNELSLNWERNLSKNGIISKIKYVVRDEYLSLIEKYKSNLIEDSNETSFESEYNELSVLKIHDPDIDYIKSLLDTLHPKRAKTFDLWFQVICVLAHTSKSYKPLADYFSKKCAEKYNQHDFEKFWSQASSKSSNHLTIGSLHYWAKIDNPHRYEEIRHGSLFSMIYKKIYDPQNEGNLQHFDIAEILHKSLQHKFVYDPENGGLWYEFIVDGEPQKKGEIYKWRLYGKVPNSLKRYMSQILTTLFGKVLEKVKSAYNNANGDLSNYHFMILKNFQSSCRKLRDCGFKSGTSTESEQIFERIDFHNLLDKDSEIMGVGNGILKLGKRVEFITGFHNYHISKYTHVDYKPFNPYDPITKKLIIALRNLFPDDEPDSFDFMMHYLSSSLDGKKKESIFLIFIGGGSNGKSFLMELQKSTIGEMYGGKVPLNFLTSRNSNSQNATPVLMSLMGKRFVYLSEANKCERANCARVKEITGLETLAGRKLFGDMVNFKPTSNIILTTNHLLEFDSNDHGMWRRIKIVPAKMKFCKKNIDDMDDNNPYEREADLSMARDWGDDPDVQSSYLSILTYYYESLYKNYNGVVENVPHPNIQEETYSYRNKQDRINNFISMKLITSNDPDDEVTMSDLIEKYSRWHESLYPDDKAFKKGLQQVFENSQISGLFTYIKGIGKTIKGYRVLDNSERPEEGEKYFSDICNIKNKKKNYSKLHIKSETSQEFYERLCIEYDDYISQKRNSLKSNKQKKNLKKKKYNQLPKYNQESEYKQGLPPPNDKLEQPKSKVLYTKSGFKKNSTKKLSNIFNIKKIIQQENSDTDDDSYAELSNAELSNAELSNAELSESE